MNMKEIPLEKKIAAALEASEQEKYEILQKIAESLSEQEKEFFFEVVDLILPSYKKQ